MKKITFFIIALVLHSTVLLSQNWVNFSNSEQSAPKINILTSNTQTVSFTVTVPGIYTQDTVVNGIAFTRLIFSGGGAINPAGSPELPVLNYRVAIPNCDAAMLTYQVTSQQTLPSCWVYPVPEMVWEQNTDESKILIEQFVFDSVAYAQPCIPEPVSMISSSGAFRDQQYVEVTFSPVAFCPVSRQLSIIDKIVVTLTFTAPKGDILQELGIFSDVAATAFINYEDTGQGRGDTLIPGQQAPFIKFINLQDTAQACKIVCDYLIITMPEFYNNPQLLLLAEHRKNLNGYDVAIVDVSQILGLNFEYEDYPIQTYMKEQKMRTFIRRVFEGKNAWHIADHHLAFVLLVGDNYKGNTGMPTSKDMNDGFPTDYYFSCVTRDAAGKYDKVGDLAIGRFSVEDSTQLFNMVHKTINFESEYSPQAWRKTALFTNGGNDSGNNMNNVVIQDYLDKMQNLNLFKNGKWTHKIVNYFVNPEFKEPTLNYMNAGAAFVQYYGHGWPDSWQEKIHQNDFYQMLNNPYKVPFINTFACSTGRFDNYTTGGGGGSGSGNDNDIKIEYEECLAEFLTRYDPIKGAVGYIGASRDIPLPMPQSHNHIINYPNYFLSLLFGDSTIAIAGKLLLQTKLCNDEFILKYQDAFNLFGDPALDIFAEGYEITRDVTADAIAEITVPVRVHKGATLTIPANGTLQFVKNGTLIVEKDGNLVVGNGALIYSKDKNLTIDTIPKIHVKGGGFATGYNATFKNLNGGILLEDEFGQITYDENKQFNLQNATFNNTPLTHCGTKLNVSNCTFNSGSNIQTSVSMSNIDNCTFNNSTFTSIHSGSMWSLHPAFLKPLTTIGSCHFNGNNDGIALKLISSSALNLYNNTITGYETGISLTSSGTTISYIYSPDIISSISGNNISNCSTGIELYSSVANLHSNEIYNNNYGVRLYNNSSTSFGKEFPSQPHQAIRDCESMELYASSNSFPAIFIYNQVIDEDNGGNSVGDPLLYWDVRGNMLPKDVNFNNWGNSFNRLEDLYPPELFICDSIWLPIMAGTSKRGTEETLLQTGLGYFANEDYTNAETTFKELIETYPESRFAIAAMHELFALEHFSGSNYYKLYNYYTFLASLDSNLFETAEFLETRCHVKERNWQPAVNWYENRIENPPSYQDSIFAVIDLGDIHLMMESDTANGAKSNYCYYRLAEMKPKSKQEFETNKVSLLATLPQIKNPQTEEPHSTHRAPHTSGALGQCIPNPTNGNATISYEIYTEGVVEIQIYNSSGQLVKSLPQETLEKGNYQAKVSFAGVSAGLYHYALLVNGEKTDAKKLIVN